MLAERFASVFPPSEEGRVAFGRRQAATSLRQGAVPARVMRLPRPMFSSAFPPSHRAGLPGVLRRIPPDSMPQTSRRGRAKMHPNVDLFKRRAADLGKSHYPHLPPAPPDNIRSGGAATL